MKLKLLIAPLVLLSLVTGLLTGLYRIGWIELEFIRNSAAMHGAIMTGSFLGTLISLERAIPLKKWYGYIVPLVSALSLPAWLAGQPVVAAMLLSAGSLGLMGIMYYYYHKYQETHHLIILMGAASWFTGNVLLATQAGLFTIVPWWMGFLLLTITGERLELTKYLALTRGRKLLLIAALMIFIAGCILPFHMYGNLFMGAGLFLSGTWLLKFDIAGKSLRKSGIFRYNAILLTLGYIWLMIIGLMAAFLPMTGLMYDAVLHGFFLGFTFSMVFAHAPIIMPAVLGFTGQLYHRSLYIWGVVLHGSLAIRLLADVYLWYDVRKWSGLISGLAILIFIGEMAFMAIRKRQSTRKKHLGKVGHTVRQATVT